MIINMIQENLHTFVPHNSLDQLFDILSKNFVFLKAFDSNILCNKVWFTDQNSEPLEIEDKINITLSINVQHIE